VSLPSGWSAATAIDKARRGGSCKNISWSGHAWRNHSSRFPAESYGGSLRNTGRFHRGRDFFPEDQCWPVLYLSLDGHISNGEFLRHFFPSIPPALGHAASQAVMDNLATLLNSTPPLPIDQITQQLAMIVGQAVANKANDELSSIKNRVLSEVIADLPDVLDCTNVIALGLNPPGVNPPDLYDDAPHYETSHALAYEVRSRGYDAMLIPSATGYGNNLIVFPDNLTPPSHDNRTDPSRIRAINTLRLLI